MNSDCSIWEMLFETHWWFWKKPSKAGGKQKPWEDFANSENIFHHLKSSISYLTEGWIQLAYYERKEDKSIFFIADLQGMYPTDTAFNQHNKVD